MHRWLQQTMRIFRVVIHGRPLAIVGPCWRVPFGVSALVHKAGLGLLALVAVAHPHASDVATILADWAEPAPDATASVDAPVDTQLTSGSSPGGRAGEAGLPCNVGNGHELTVRRKSFDRAQSIG